MSEQKPTRGGRRIPSPGKSLGRPKNPRGVYEQVPLKLPPELVKWLAENTDNRNGFIVEAIREKIKRAARTTLKKAGEFSKPIDK